MRGKKTIKTAVVYLIGAILLCIALYPYLYMVFNSLAPWDEVDKGFIPSHFSLRSYRWLIFGEQGVATKPWIKAFFNSLFVTTASTLLMMLFGVMIAYALAKINFKGRKR